jgi:hypothetical protein
VDAFRSTLSTEVRPPSGAQPSACSGRFYIYDDLHRDYCYKPEWVEFLSEKLADAATYEAVIGKRKTSVKPGTTKTAAA